MKYVSWLLPILLLACQPQTLHQPSYPPTNLMVLGKQKENPYSIAIMQAAYQAHI